MQRSGLSTMVLKHRPYRVAFVLLWGGIWVFSAGGCASRGVRLRSAPQNPLVERLDLASWWGPKASDRTMQVLRVHNLLPDLKDDPRPLLKKLQAILERDPSPEKVYAFSELAYIGAKTAEQFDKKIAMDLYGASALYAYHYLFGRQLAEVRNPYDPQYRGACELYNAALEGALRIECICDGLVPGQTKTIQTAAGSWDITCVLRDTGWRAEDIAEFKFVSDYEITGLTNHYRTHGLGVPLIAVRRSDAAGTAAASHYPPGLSFPVTALLRPLPDTKPCTGRCRLHRQCVLELYDPLTTTDTPVADRLVPLESDLTTPLAYFLSNPALEDLATVGLLTPEALLQMGPGRQQPIMGLYMVQPYEPGKIPVVMVHGVWSSPMTWLEMFNDLRSIREIREHYQFWFYLYPTGQPFWISAGQLRADLAEVRRVLDPYHREPALDQMVLVGHSMGGLLSKLQTIDSRDDYWKLVSREPFERVKAEPAVRQKLAETFFFRSNPSIRRVVTIGTPHRGTDFSNQTTQWLLGKLITLPRTLAAGQERLFRENKGLFHERSLLKVQTSIDSLAPGSPVFETMLAGRRPPWVKYHNIVGVIPDVGWWTSIIAGSDGVVSQQNARLDDAQSEVTVAADHTTVHSHPAAVLEVRRILCEHLAELHGRPIHQLTPPGELPPFQAVVPAIGPWGVPVGDAYRR